MRGMRAITVLEWGAEKNVIFCGIDCDFSQCVETVKIFGTIWSNSVSFGSVTMKNTLILT